VAKDRATSGLIPRDEQVQLLDPAMVLGAYAVGVFPMADARAAKTVYWVEPRRRAVLPLDRFHLSRSLAKTLRQERFTVTADRAFARIIALCAESVSDRQETWINHSIERAFLELHTLGYAHSVEVWRGEELVGGLYGLALGRAFFGESMVSRASDASKVALAALVARLRVGGFRLLDCQFMTSHLASMGAEELSRDDYMVSLAEALGEGVGLVDRGAFRALDDLVAAGDASSDGAAPPAGTPGKVIAQLLVHTS
jgi:leucyl/phenylalanyl-tRNA---protein transferase